MRISRSNLAVSATALACAGVFGGVFAVSLVGGQQPDRDQTTVVRNVSDAGAEATPSGQASAPAAASSATASAAADPAQMSSTTSSTTNGSQTVTEPAPNTQPAPVDAAPDPVTEPAPTTEPAPVEPAPSPEPPAPPANSGGESGPPVGNQLPTGPTEYPCLPQEYGINPRCPAPAPTS